MISTCSKINTKNKYFLLTRGDGGVRLCLNKEEKAQGEGQNKQPEGKNKMRISIPVKEIVLTAIANKGTTQVRREAQNIADECFAKKQSVLNWVRRVEKGEIIIK